MLLLEAGMSLSWHIICTSISLCSDQNKHLSLSTLTIFFFLIILRPLLLRSNRNIALATEKEINFFDCPSFGIPAQCRVSCLVSHCWKWVLVRVLARPRNGSGSDNRHSALFFARPLTVTLPSHSQYPGTHISVTVFLWTSVLRVSRQCHASLIIAILRTSACGRIL